MKFRVLVTKEQLDEKTAELAKAIERDYKGKDLLLVGVLKGGFIFLADLVRKLSMDLAIDFISVSSYGNSTESSGVVRIIKDIDSDITGKHVLLVEDLIDTEIKSIAIDTGLTLNYLKELFNTKGCASVKLAAILDKPERRKVDLTVDYAGITIPDEFVVGYGLDWAGKYRNLPDVCVVEET